MKIIHTSDWHIGKNLNGFSRIEEQKKFIDDFVNIVEEKNVDIVVIAGDIYDVTTPSIEAEQLFYTSMERISRGGETIVIVSAGNHDSADRLSASKVWGAKLGVIVTGTINDEVIETKIETKIKNFEIKPLDKGVFSVVKNSDGVVEKATFLNLAYPSETRLNHKIESIEDKEYGELYTEHIKGLLDEKSKYFTDDSYNILIGHFLMFGGSVSDSEKELNIGGLDSLKSNILPQNADYVALGHLHKKQKISGHNNCYYSGSPLQYSKSEKDNVKYIGLIDSSDKTKEVEFLELSVYKPIEVLHCTDIESTIEYITNQEIEKWYYIEVEQKAIETSKVQALRNASDSILEIIPIKKNVEYTLEALNEDREEKSILENFVDYFKLNNGNEEPSQDIIKLFLDLVGEE